MRPNVLRLAMVTATAVVIIETSVSASCQGESQDSHPAEAVNTPFQLQSATVGDWLDDARIRFYGYIEGSYTYNPAHPPGGINEVRYFDQFNDTILLNQADLTIERAVNITDSFDWGFRIESIYGHDVDLIHSNGLFDYETSGNEPRYGYDLAQAYADVVLPWNRGVHVLAGKYFTPICYETINPTTRPFYSNSFLFMFGTPYTHTGLRLDVPIDSEWSLTGAAIRGWEQSTDDNNDSLSYYVGASYASPDRKTTGSIVIITGNEQPDNNSDRRTLVDFILTQVVGEKFSVAVNADYTTEAGSATNGDRAKWYGIAAYGTYDISNNVKGKVRVEWFRDDGASRTGFDTDLYEATLGVSWTPFPDGGWLSNFVVRPEIRGDWASSAIYDGGTRSSQYTVAVDVIFTF